jgi:hypothetical protein
VVGTRRALPCGAARERRPPAGISGADGPGIPVAAPKLARAAAPLVFGDGMTVETDAANTLAAAPLVFGDGMTVETDAAASLAAAPLVFGDGMTAVETDAAASVLTGVV